MKKINEFTKEELIDYAKRLFEMQKGAMHVCISHVNKKMGENIPSVSIWPFLSCRKCGCMEMRTDKRWWCYAINMILREMQRQKGHNWSNSGESWLKNSYILEYYPEQFWREVEAAVMMARFFRFHIGGDFVNGDYFDHVCQIAIRNPSTKILAFTKKFSIVNSWIDINGPLPANLKVIFSAWPGLEMDNRHGLTECHVVMKDGSGTFKGGDAFECPGSCEECAMGCMGCWSDTTGKILIKEH